MESDTGYGVFGGTRTSAEELKVLFEYLEKNGLLNPDRILTGEHVLQGLSRV